MAPDRSHHVSLLPNHYPEDDNDAAAPGKAAAKPDVCTIDESDSEDDLGVDVVDDDPEVSSTY